VARGFVVHKEDILPAMGEDKCCNRSLLRFADLERTVDLFCNQSHSVDGCVVRWDDWIDHTKNPLEKVLVSKQPSFEGTMQVKIGH
jgi:hypothetical protein